MLRSDRSPWVRHRTIDPLRNLRGDPLDIGIGFDPLGGRGILTEPAGTSSLSILPGTPEDPEEEGRSALRDLLSQTLRGLGEGGIALGQRAGNLLAKGPAESLAPGAPTPLGMPDPLRVLMAPFRENIEENVNRGAERERALQRATFGEPEGKAGVAGAFAGRGAAEILPFLAGLGTAPAGAGALGRVGAGAGGEAVIGLGEAAMAREAPEETLPGGLAPLLETEFARERLGEDRAGRIGGALETAAQDPALAFLSNVGIGTALGGPLDALFGGARGAARGAGGAVEEAADAAPLALPPGRFEMGPATEPTPRQATGRRLREANRELEREARAMPEPEEAVEEAVESLEDATSALREFAGEPEPRPQADVVDIADARRRRRQNPISSMFDEAFEDPADVAARARSRARERPPRIGGFLDEADEPNPIRRQRLIEEADAAEATARAKRLEAEEVGRQVDEVPEPEVDTSEIDRLIPPERAVETPDPARVEGEGSGIEQADDLLSEDLSVKKARYIQTGDATLADEIAAGIDASGVRGDVTQALRDQFGDTIRVYRAGRVEPGQPQSWTTDRRVAENFAEFDEQGRRGRGAQREIVERDVQPEDVMFPGAVSQSELVIRSPARATETNPVRARRLEAEEEALPTRAEAEPVEARERTPGPTGRTTRVKSADNTEVAATFRVLDSAAVRTSHDPVNFSRNEGFPEGVQERRYHDNPADQEAVINTAQNLDPDLVLDPTIRPTDGPPIVTPDGVALSGNQRAMAIARAARQSPERFEAYKQALIERADEFGLDPDEIRQMETPVLVREVADDSVDLTDRGTLAEASSRFNEPSAKQRTALEEAGVRARRLEDDSQAITMLSEKMEPDQSVRQFLDTSDGRGFVKRLEEEGVITKQERSRFLDSKTGAVTAEGREMVEQALLAKAIGDPEVIARAPASALRQIDTSVPAIVQAAAHQGFDLGPTIGRAFDILSEAQQKGFKSVNDLLGQLDLERTIDPDSPAAKLAQFLEGASKRETTEAFRSFAKDAQSTSKQAQSEDLFGFEPVTPREAFDRRFVGETTGAGTEATASARAKGDLDDLPPAPEPRALGETQVRRTAGVTTAEAVDAAKRVGVAARERGNAIREFFRAPEKFKRRATFFLGKGMSHVRTFGEAGKKLADQTERVTRLAQARTEQSVLAVREVFEGMTSRLHTSEREQIGRFLMGRIDVEDLDSSLRPRAERLRAIWDKDMEEYALMGGKRRQEDGTWVPIEGSGNPMPQVLNKKGWRALEEIVRSQGATPRIRRWAEQAKESGQYDSVEDAIDGLLQYSKARLKGTNGYLEQTRILLPEDWVELDPLRVSGQLAENNATTIEAAREWGLAYGDGVSSHPVLEDMIDRLSRHGTNEEVGAIKEFYEANVGTGAQVLPYGKSFLTGASNYETAVRLGLSPLSALRNMGQRWVNLADYPIGVHLKAIKKYPPVINRWMKSAKEIEQRLLEQGSVSPRTAQVELVRGRGEKAAQGVLKWFTEVEKGNQTYSALVSQIGLERDLKQMAKLESAEGINRFMASVWGGRATNAARRTQRVLNMSDEEMTELITSGRRLSPDEMEEAAFRLVNDSQFALNMATRPLWWEKHPFWRLMFKFKTFGLRQVELIHDRVLVEAIKGNPAPLTRFTAGTILLGEMYNVARDNLLGNEEAMSSRLRKGEALTGEEVAWTAMKNLADGGGIGMLADLSFGIGSYVFGPAGSTVQNFAEYADAIRTRSGDLGDATKNFIRREVSAVRQAEGAVRKLTGTAERYEKYRRFRQRAFEHRDSEENETVSEKASAAVGDMIRGSVRFPPSERTIRYEYAARAITAGDIDDAAEYLASILRDAEDRAERESFIAGIKQSAKNQAPIPSSAIAERDQAAFLRKFPLDERRDMHRFHEQWLNDYEKALTKAKGLARMSR